MANRSRQGSPPGTRNRTTAPRGDTERRTPPAQKHATTADPLRQQQALSNQGSQGRMAAPWRTRSEDDEDEDDVPPTLH